jgi:hypothetical protein
MALGACAKKSSVEPGQSIAGEQSKPGASLAYEHTVAITAPREGFDQRLEAVRAACLDERFGACSLLSFEQSSDYRLSGSISVRLVPDAVEPLVALATEGGEQGSRTTRAEDLAEAVADTAAHLERLQLQRSSLLQYQSRPDLSVSDMLTIARELSAIEAELQGHERSAANQTRRLETNLLTFAFTTPYEDSRFTRLSEALADSLDTAIEGVTDAIGFVAYGLPILIVAFPLALFWRMLWRRATRASRLR